ncbi:hypothetical protein Tco_1173669 [Tanacetum coccineum]
MGLNDYRFSFSWSIVLPGEKLKLGINQVRIEHAQYLGSWFSTGHKGLGSLFPVRNPCLSERDDDDDTERSESIPSVFNDMISTNSSNNSHTSGWTTSDDERMLWMKTMNVLLTFLFIIRLLCAIFMDYRRAHYYEFHQVRELQRNSSLHESSNDDDEEEKLNAEVIHHHHWPLAWMTSTLLKRLKTVGTFIFNSPVIVLDEDCLNSKDLSNSLIGRVKDVGSLSNLKKVLCNEGDGFRLLRQASHDFTPEGKVHLDSELKKLATGGYPSSPKNEEEMIILNRNSISMNSRSWQSEDPFGLYSILNKNKVKSDVIREVNDENPSLKYPPGFTPSVEKNGSKSKDDQVQNISDNQLNGDNDQCIRSLKRFLSDHRPILLREASFDYGPTPFWFFHFWFDVDGFDKFVTDSWKICSWDESNAMRNLYGNREVSQVNKAQASEVAQKAKIKWYVEGDENTKFFHGMLNKKRILQHFPKHMFDKPPDQNAHIDMPFFPNSLSADQQKTLSYGDAIFLGQWNDSNIDTLVHVMECF